MKSDIEREEPIFGERDPKETEIESVIVYENEENEDVMKEYEDSERETAIEARTPKNQGSVNGYRMLPINCNLVQDGVPSRIKCF